jgi:hypothetical protein
VIAAPASAWREDVLWGALITPEGNAIIWGRTADTGAPWSVVPGEEEGLLLDEDAGILESPWPGDDSRELVAASLPDSAPQARDVIPAVIPHGRRRTRIRRGWSAR